MCAMAYTNKQILAAVLTKWAQPVIQQLLAQRMGSLPFVGNVEAKIKSTGWVSPMWSIAKELSPMTGSLTSSVVGPMIANYLSNMPVADEAIPQMAHNIVEDALRNGGLTLFEGAVELEMEDLEELRKLLRYNLPIKEVATYEVITEEPTPQGEEVAE